MLGSYLRSLNTVCSKSTINYSAKAGFIQYEVRLCNTLPLSMCFDLGPGKFANQNLNFSTKAGCYHNDKA